MAEDISEHSILTDVKADCGIAEDYTEFDNQIIGYINTAFAIGFQFGIGYDGKGDEPFHIEGNSETWSEIYGDREALFLIRTYISNFTQLQFDPPSSSFVLDAKKGVIDELECRIKYAMELPSLSEGSVTNSNEN